MAFQAGFDAVIVVGGVDISSFTSDVKFDETRKDYDLPVLGGAAVKSMVGPTKTNVSLTGFIDPTCAAVFTTHMSEATPSLATVAYSPQGVTGGTPRRTANAFVVDYSEDTPSEGPGKWTAKLTVDGLVTNGTN